MKPYVNKRKCPAQEAYCQAITACPMGAISYVVDEREKLGGKIVFDYDKCNECGACVSGCCGEAIEVR